MSFADSPDDWDDSRDDHELPEEDEFDDDEIETLPCPECGAEVYEDAPRCPSCGSYITFATHPFTGRAWWWVALGLLGILALIVTLAIAGFG